MKDGDWVKGMTIDVTRETAEAQDWEALDSLEVKNVVDDYRLEAWMTR